MKINRHGGEPFPPRTQGPRHDDMRMAQGAGYISFVYAVNWQLGAWAIAPFSTLLLLVLIILFQQVSRQSTVSAKESCLSDSNLGQLPCILGAIPDCRSVRPLLETLLDMSSDKIKEPLRLRLCQYIFYSPGLSFKTTKNNILLLRPHLLGSYW